CGGGPRVDEDDHRRVRMRRRAAALLDARAAAIAPPGGDDGETVVEEPAGNGHRLLEQSAGVVAQIEDDALERRVAQLRLQPLQLPPELGVGAILEALDAQMCHISV